MKKKLVTMLLASCILASTFSLTVCAEPVEVEAGVIFDAEYYAETYPDVVNVLGDEAVKEILGSDKVNDIDVGELELIILKIKAAYDKPIEEYRAEQLENSLEGIPTEKLVALTKAVNTINSTNVTAIKK